MKGFIMLHYDVICMFLHCPGHATLNALECAITFLTLPGPLTTCFPSIGCLFVFLLEQ